MKFDKSPYVVKRDRWDQQVYEDVLFDMGALKANQDKIWKTHDFVDDAWSDLFLSLFLGDPMNFDSKDLLEDRMMNDMIVNEFQSWTEVSELRVSTKFKEFESAFAMLKMQPELEKLWEQNQEMVDLMNQISELLKELSETTDPGAAGELVKQIQALQGEAADMGRGIKIDFKSAAKKASKELAEDASLMRTFGLEEGQLQRMDFKERYNLSKQLKTSKMLNFANLIGQFKLVAKGARRSKVSSVPDEVAGVQLGDDLSALAIESMIAMATPELELKFWNGFFNHELVQKKLVGPHALGKGPIIVVCDESGSMSEAAYGGTREQWSKALSLALCDQARKNKRDFTYIGFSGAHATYSVHFPKGRVQHAKLIEFIEHFFGGGTYPFGALLEAVDRVAASPKNNKPDIVFITDGEFGSPHASYDNNRDFYQEWNACKAKYQMQCFGIAFDGEPREMKALADTVINLDSMMSNPEKMSAMFQQIDRD